MLKLILANALTHLNGTTKLKIRLQEYLGPGWRVEGLPAPLPAPQEAFNVKRGQWDAEMLLEHYDLYAAKHALFRDSPGKLLALFPHDMYYAKRSFTFGLSYLGGRDSIVSYNRLFDSKVPMESQAFYERLFKESVHELGHAQGLRHCHTRTCVMCCSPRVGYIDRKNAGMCAKCKGMMAIVNA